MLAVPAGFWFLQQRVCGDPPEWGLSLCYGSSSEMMALLIVLTICGVTPLIAWWLPRLRDFALVGPVAALVLGIDVVGQSSLIAVIGRCCYASYSTGPFGILASPPLLTLYELLGIGACFLGLSLAAARLRQKPLAWRLIGGSTAIVANGLGMTVLTPWDSWIGGSGAVFFFQQSGPSTVAYPADMLVPVAAAIMGLLAALPYWRPQRWLVGVVASAGSIGMGLLAFFPFVPVAVIAGFVTLFAADRQGDRWAARKVRWDGASDLLVTPRP